MHSDTALFYASLGAAQGAFFMLCSSGLAGLAGGFAGTLMGLGVHFLGG